MIHINLYTILYRSTGYPIPYPVPCTLVYKRNKPLRHVHRRGRRYRTKKYPVRFKPYGVCNERDVNPYSVEGVEVSAPKIPAIVIVTSPINIEPNDCTAVNSSLPAYPIKKTATVANSRAKNFRAMFCIVITSFD